MTKLYSAKTAIHIILGKLSHGCFGASKKLKINLQYFITIKFR